MPSLVTKRGRRRYLGTVWVNGHRGPTRLFPDDSKKSYKAAVEWEAAAAREVRQKMAEAATATAYSGLIRLDEWTDDYLDWIMNNGFADKTYREKKAAFVALANHPGVSKDMTVDAIDRFLAAELFDTQVKSRSGNAVNKDRKNLGVAWQWGRNHYRQWPKGDNPFLAVAKKHETRQPRYVPPEADFWKVYDHVANRAHETGTAAAVQDRVMLLAYLHLAARRSELFRALWSDVDFSRGSIRLWTSKREGNGMEYDWLPMSKELTAELKMWAEQRLGQDTDDKQHVFVCLSEVPVNEQYYGLPFIKRSHVLARWCKKVKVNKFGWHAIRHLTASTLYRRGYSLSHIQAVLRHKSATTTARYLRSLGVNEVRDMLDAGLRRQGGEVIPFANNKTASPGQGN